MIECKDDGGVNAPCDALSCAELLAARLQSENKDQEFRLDQCAAIIERQDGRIAALEALALGQANLLSELIDIEGPQPGTNAWAVKVKAALSSPLLAELRAKDATQ